MNVVMLQGHPDSATPHFCHALAQAYAEGATAAGVTVTEFRVADLDFPLLRTKDEFEGPVLPQLLPVQDAIRAAEHLLLVFPLWMGTLPALFKGLLEQVMKPGFAVPADGSIGGLLGGRSARLIVTMGMPAPAYRWWFGAHGVRNLERNVLRFAGLKPVRRTLIGSVEALAPARREAWLTKMREFGSRAS